MGHAYANYFSKAYIVSYRKCQKKKKKKNHRFISWQNPVKVKKKKKPQKIKQFQYRNCRKHSWPLSYSYWPVIAVLQQCADGMATV